MDDLSLPLTFPFSQAPAEAEICPVVEGVGWIRMPLPFALDHVNLWCLSEIEAVTLVDTGLGTARTQEIWHRLFSGPLAGQRVTQVLVTHFHPDHVGCADWLTRTHDASLLMTRTEWLMASYLIPDATPAMHAGSDAFYRRAGVDDAAMAALSGQALGYGRGVPAIPSSFQRLQEGQFVRLGHRLWRVLIGRGHSPEHACLWNEEDNILIAGDQILPSITPNVSVWADEPDADPLGDFLDSLAMLSRLPEDCLVLPAHGRPFRGIRARAKWIAHHHEQRLEETLSAARLAPLSAAALTRQMFPKAVDPFQFRFAVGEALAHLNRLRATGDLATIVGVDGIVRFVPT